MMTSDAAALFVDFENLYYRLLDAPFSLRGDEALSKSLDVLNELRDAARKSGHSLIVERCYADWELMPMTAQRQLQIAGILPRYVDSRRKKNSADIEMSLDVLNVVLTRPEITFVILVGGDRDYLPILRRLKEHHRSVRIGSLKESLSGDMREFANTYSLADVVELNQWVESKEKIPSAEESLVEVQDVVVEDLVVEDLEPIAVEKTPKTAPPVEQNHNTRKAQSIEVGEWHERYIRAMLDFLRDHGYDEVHMGPYLRWLNHSGRFDLVSHREQRKVLDDLQALGAVNIESRRAYEGHTFGVAHIDWNHSLVQSAN